jgi:hypothetical protein
MYSGLSESYPAPRLAWEKRINLVGLFCAGMLAVLAAHQTRGPRVIGVDGCSRNDLAFEQLQQPGIT